MARYEIDITARAARALSKLDRPDQLRVARAIRSLAEEPRPRGARKLTGYDDVYRIRIGRYRVLYSVEDRRLIILILKIGQRSDVYR